MLISKSTFHQYLLNRLDVSRETSKSTRPEIYQHKSFPERVSPASGFITAVADVSRETSGLNAKINNTTSGDAGFCIQ